MLVVTRSAGRSRSPSGQTLVEFAIVFPVFLLVVFSVIQFGFLMGGQDGITNAVREATRYASTLPVANTTDAGTCATGTGRQAYNQLLASMQAKVPGYSLSNLAKCGAAAPATTVSYCIRQNPDSTYAIYVTVTAVYRHPLFVPLVGPIIDRLDGTSDNALRATATEQMRVETFNLSGSYLGGFPTCS